MNRFVIVVTMTTNIRKNIDTINTYTKRVTKACVPRVKEKKVKTEYAAAAILVGLFNRCCLRKSTNEMTKTAIEWNRGISICSCIFPAISQPIFKCFTICSPISFRKLKWITFYSLSDDAVLAVIAYDTSEIFVGICLCQGVSSLRVDVRPPIKSVIRDLPLVLIIRSEHTRRKIINVGICNSIGVDPQGLTNLWTSNNGLLAGDRIVNPEAYVGQFILAINSLIIKTIPKQKTFDFPEAALNATGPLRLGNI